MSVQGDDILMAMLIAADLWGRGRWNDVEAAISEPNEREAIVEAVWRRQMYDNQMQVNDIQSLGRSWNIYGRHMGEATSRRVLKLG